MQRNLYPLSVDLNQKKVLVIGGGEVAARKLSELIYTGSKVTVIAKEMNPAILRLEKAITLITREYQEGDIAGYYLVFACTDQGSVNAQIAATCDQNHTLCNVADNGALGSFHVPGVIRHGEITVTVSTGGLAPGLTRHLKRKLAEFLGPELGELAQVLGRFRKELKEKFSRQAPEHAGRILQNLPYRKLLEDVKNRGAGSVEKYLQDLLRSELENAGGKILDNAGEGDAREPEWSKAKTVVQAVTLVGAGPGHAGLLTLLGAEALKKADVIVHDRLIPEETLQLAPVDCLLIAAGKRGHFESMRQETINAKLVQHALAGKNVVRLKGGDPFIFGRGWEEVLALEAEGIPWKVIPGISSTHAGPAWAGIPLTHRGVARSYAVMSGMAYAPNKLTANIDAAGQASQTNTEIPKADTIVLLMGLQRLQEIVAAFLAQGWDAKTPVAAIQNATQANERICISTLEDIEKETVRGGFDSPTLLVIGKVVDLHLLPLK